MADFTLSGQPVGNPDEFPIEPVAQISGDLTIAAVIDPSLLSASATVSGFVVLALVGTVTGTPNLGVGGGPIFGTFASAASLNLPFALLGGALNADLAATGVAAELGVLPIYAPAQLSGTLSVQASVSGLLSGTAALDGGSSHEEFIGAGDVLGNELLSAAASANMTGEPDTLKDGGSPPFVIFDGSTQYLFYPDQTDADLRGGAAFSCAVVFDPEVVNNGGTGTLVGKHDPGSTEWGWRVHWDATTGEVTVIVSSAADGSNRATRTTAVGGAGIRNRTVVAFTWDSSALELYVAGSSSQGAQSDTGTPGAMVAGNAQFAIGADSLGSAPANFFQGAIHAVHVFDDVLSSGEVATIDESGYVPGPLVDANLVASWRPDRIEGSTSNIVIKRWRDEAGARELTMVNQPLCFPGIAEHLRWFCDEWDMDFVNAQVVGVSLDQNLASNYPLSTSSTNIVENGGFRRYQPPTFQLEPEIVSGFRTEFHDITVIWGGRKDSNSAADVVWLELYGLQVYYDAQTLELDVYQGAVGTPTRYQFGVSVVGMEGTVPNGAATVFALRYNKQLDQFTLFINGVKKFEISTAVTGTAISNTGLRFCESVDWAAINPFAPQTARRAAKIIPACLPDLLLSQTLNELQPGVYGQPDGLDGRMRAALREAPQIGGDLLFGQLVGVDYDITREVDDEPPSPRATFEPHPEGSGTIEFDGLPLDGEQVTISDGTTTVTLEFDNNSSVSPGTLQVPISVTITQTLLNVASVISTSGLNLTAGAPVVFTLDGVNEVGYVRIRQDDLADGDLPLMTVPTGPLGNVRVTGPYRVQGPRGSLELFGQPADGDQFVVNDRVNPVRTFEFDSGGGVTAGAVAVTIGADVEETMDNLVVAVNASGLALTAFPTIAFSSYGGAVIDRAYSVVEHARSSDPTDYANRFDAAITTPTNVSGNLAATGIEQPKPFEEALQVQQSSVYGQLNSAIESLYVDAPYAVLEPEPDEDEGATIPPFVNPNPVVVSVTANEAKIVTATANAGPTDAGDVRSWWEVEIVPGDSQFNLRIDEKDNSFALNKNQVDTFPVPEGLNFDEKRIRFVIQSQLDPDQIWFSLYVRMEGDQFDNSTTEVIIIPGAGAPEPPPQIELEISLAEQQFVVEEDIGRLFRQLRVSNRSRYKLTPLFVNHETDPRIEGRNEDGLEFGLLSVLDDFLTLGTNIRTYAVSATDIGFLDRIAARFYGSGFEDFWWAIAYVNRIVDVDTDMFVGQRLVLPPREALTAFLARKPTPTGT
jgi:hypothetical protein